MTEKSVSLLVPRLPRLVSNLAHSVSVLKFFAVCSFALASIAIVSATFLALRPVKIIALSPEGTRLQETAMPKLSDEVEAAILRYVSLRYDWAPENIKGQMAQARSMVAPASLKAFDNSMMNVVHFSIEKQVAQRFYPKVRLDLNRHAALVTGDRVSVLGTLMGAGQSRIELTFETGARTDENPWGIYVVKESEK